MERHLKGKLHWTLCNCHDCVDLVSTTESETVTYACDLPVHGCKRHPNRCAGTYYCRYQTHMDKPVACVA